MQKYPPNAKPAEAEGATNRSHQREAQFPEKEVIANAAAKHWALRSCATRQNGKNDIRQRLFLECRMTLSAFRV